MIRKLRRRLDRRVPVVRQFTETDCGPACLLSLLRYREGDAAIAEIRHLAGTDTRGTSLFQLARAAAALGLPSEGCTGTFDDLRTAKLPLIAHIITPDGLHHYVVVERVAGDRIWIMDPAVGRRTLRRDAFEALWVSRAALLVAEGEPAGRRAPVTWWSWIGSHLNAEQAFLAQAIFLGLLYTALGLFSSLFVRILIDDLIPTGETRPLVLAGMLLLMVLALRAVVGYGRQYLLALLQRRVGTSVNEAFVSHLFRIPLPYFERTRKGDVTARLQDSLTLQSGAVHLVGGVIADGTMVLGVAAGLALLAPQLLWIAIGGIPLYGLLLLWAAGDLHRRQKEVMHAFTNTEARYIDSLQGVRELLAGAGRAAADRNHASWNQFLLATQRLTFRTAALGAVAEALGGALLIIALTFGAMLVLSGDLLLGQMIAGYTLLSMLLPAIARIAELFVTLQTTRVAGARVLDILQAPTSTSSGHEPFAMTNSIALEEVSFTWPRGQQQLEEVTLVLARGRVTGLRGANGSGKTTIVKLLRREYRPTAGRVLVDDREAEAIDLTSYQSSVGLLASEVAVFSGTLFENISLGRPNITPEGVVAVIQEVGLARFFSRFPAGLATPIGEDGQQLSAGERCMLGLVRALAPRPAVLIIDEAFAMLDAEASEALLATARRLSSDCAVLLISHDPSVLAHADLIYTLEGGRILPPEPSMEASPLFAVAERDSGSSSFGL